MPVSMMRSLLAVAQEAAKAITTPPADSSPAPLPPTPVWPQLTNTQFYAIIFTPIGFTILCIVLLAMWPAPKKGRKPATESTPLNGGKTHVVLDAGEVAGDYSAPWTQTFDLVLLLGMLAALVALLIWTCAVKPALFVNWMFWRVQIPKMFIMIGVSVLMGLICRRFCKVDDLGYIMTNKGSWFKVNYTRKVQHLAAYLVPLLVKTPPECDCSGTLETAWGQWFTMLAFLCMIKPIRERSTLFMLQFNSMDRPEDRPYTLKWIIAGNIIWGQLLILVWRTIYAPIGHADLSFIFIYITGLGDGFAEPVGIWLGRHKYQTRSCTESRKYTRSYEGSACVFLSGMIFTSVYYYGFNNSTQFWTCFFVLGPIMALAEATAPHTMDTPILMGLGGLIIYLCVVFL